MFLRLVRWFSFALLATPAVWAQSQFGGIRGLVLDPTNAPIAQADVRAVNDATQVGFSTVSRDTGDFLITGLLPGAYTLTVKKPGFREHRLTGVIITAGYTDRRDALLQVGDLSQSIEVSADSARLQTESAAVVNEVPMQYLNRPATLFYGSLLPASNYMTQSPGVTFGGGQDITAHGSRAKDNRQTLDGAVLNADGSTGGVRLPRRSILELQTALLNADAEHATTTTASMFTAKGTNEFHGEVWTEIGNASLTATPWSAPGRGPGTPDVRMGYRFTGPVLIPKLYNGRNKTFFHTSLERYNPKLTFPYPTTVPTDRMRSGDLRELGRDVRDPLTGRPFPNNTIPASRIHPVTKNALERFYPAFSGAFETNNYYALENIRWSQLDWFARVDQAIGSRNNLSVSFARNRYNQNNPIFGGLLNQGRAYSFQTLHFFNISDVHVLTPSIINEANFGFRLGPHTSNESDLYGNEVNQQLGLPVPAGAPSVKGGPRFSVPGITSVAFNAQSVSDGRFWTFRDNLSWIRGRWTTKAGVEVVNPGNITDTYGDIYGSYNFTGFATGQALGDFLLGAPFTTSRALPFGYSSRVQKLIGVFVQEELRFTKALTLTFGARFQYNTTPIEEQGRYYNFDIPSGNLVVEDQAALNRLNPGLSPDIRSHIVTRDKVSGFPERLVKPMRQLTPRLGLAYQITGSTVLRAGYSNYGIQQNFGPFTGGPFNAGLEDFTNRMVCTGDNVGCQPIFTLSNPFPSGAGAQGFRPVAGLGVSGVVPNLRTPLTHQANFSIQQKIPGAMVLRASYVMTRGSRLSYRRNINIPPPSTTPFTPSRRIYQTWTGVSLTETGANSIYHAAELELDRRFANGLTINAGYTLAKCLTDADEYDGVAGGLAYLASIGSSGMFSENPYDRARDRGNCHVVPRHAFKSTFTLDLPFGKGRKFFSDTQGLGGGLINTILGGWTVSGFFIARTGQFYTPYFQGFDAPGTGQTDIRPDRIGSGKAANKNFTSIFNPADFVRPQAGRYGNSGRGIIEGLNGARMDGGVYKNIAFTTNERHPNLRIGIQAIYIFNVQPKGAFGRGPFIVTNPATVVGRANAYFFDGPNSYNFGSYRTVKFELAVQF